MTTEYVFALPDIGEGLAGAEVVEWFVAIGEDVEEEQPLVEVLTDKANVEIVSPVTGVVERLGAAPGETIAVGDDLVAFRLETGSAPTESGPSDAAPIRAQPQRTTTSEVPPTSAPPKADVASDERPAANADRPLTSPAVRRRAQEAGVDLGSVGGSGPAGRILHEDLERLIEDRDAILDGAARDDTVTEIPIIGLRRRIAERMVLASSRIPHITYVDEVDVTDLERLRTTLNDAREEGSRLTLLPFLVRAMIRAIRDQPVLNATFDDEAGVVHQHSAVHVGIATQTPNGLVVPVLRHAQVFGLWECADEVERLASAARRGEATREELADSTITITSLGRLGGLVTTPVINYPEIAIVGVNKMQVRPVWDGHDFVPRTMMNLSSSFDHRIVDGVDTATFVQRIKELLEEPATMFVEGS